DILEVIVALVAVQGDTGLRLGAVVRLADEQIDEAVAVEVQGGDAASEEGGRAGAAVPGDVSELAAAVVAEQQTRDRQDAFRAVGVVGDVEVEAAAVGQIDEQRPAGDARGPQVLLAVEAELALLIAEKRAGPRAGVVERADEQRRPTLA